MPPSKAVLTRSAILDSGSQFLETNPFRDLTVSGLMAPTGSSRSTFYQYFDDLHGLLETLLDEVKVGIVDGAQCWISGAGDPVTDLRQSLVALVDVAHRHGPVLKAVADAAPSDERLEEVWESFLAGFDEIVSTRIADDQSRGLTPAFGSLPVARALNRMNAAFLINAFGRPPKSEKPEVAAAIARIWIATLYPSASPTLIEEMLPDAASAER